MLAQTELLLRKSLEDETNLALDVSDALFGFLAQQAIEKAMKALISHRGEVYERTHNLDVLLTHLANLGEGLPALPFDITLLNEYAVDFRYDDPPPISDRAIIAESVRILREQVVKRIDALRG